MGRKKKKILFDVLGEFPENRIVCIGSKDCPGWMVIDTVKNVIDNLETIDKNQIADIKKLIAGAQHKTDVYPSRIVAIQDKLKYADDLHRKDLLTRLETAESIYHKAYRNKKRLIRALETWTPIKNRRVDSVSTSDITGKILIHVSGYVKGTKWFDGDTSQNLHAPL